MAEYSKEWWYPTGEPAASVQAIVFEGDQSTLASIFSDSGLLTPLTNPTTTDGSGVLTFYAANGDYWVYVGDDYSGDSELVTLGPAVTGAVLSVNGQTGVVVLDAGDVGADPAGSAAAAAAASQPLATINAKGDLYAGTANDTTTRRSVGTDGQVLTADSGDPTGMSWQTPTGGGISPTIFDAKGDLLAATAADAPARFPVGTNGQALRANSATSTGLEWDTLDAADVGAVPTSRILTAGTGLSGGGDLSADRTFDVDYGTTAGTAAEGNDSRITGAQQRSTLTAKGDLYAATASATTTRQPVGTDGQVLRAASGQATGLEWDTLTAGDVGADPAGSAAAAQAASQPLDSDLTAIAGLSPNNDDIIQRKAGAWTNRSIAQYKADQAYTAAEVGAIANIIMDAKGDLISATAADTPARLAVGADGTFLKANSATSTGLEWAAAGGGSGDVVGPGSATDNAVTRFDSTTGKLIQNSNLLLNDAGSLIFTGQASPSYAAGQLAYNTTSRSLSFHNDEADVTMDIGQEVWVEVRNTTGSTIANGAAVYINGTHASGVPTVALAQANAFNTSLAVGLATHSIENNTNGFITTDGTVHDLDTSAFSGGDALYLSTSTPGALTATRPSSPNFEYRVGVVTKANPSTGSIYVDPGIRRLALGTANQVLGVNSGATAEEYKTIQGTTNRLTVTHGSGTVTLDVSTTLSDSFVPKSLVDAKGDLIAATANDTPARLAAGTNGQSLYAASAESAGLLWAFERSFGFFPRSTGYNPVGGIPYIRSSKAVTLNAMYLLPFAILADGTMSAIAFEVSGAVATALVRTGIYNASASTLLPTGAAIIDNGTIDASTTGTKTVSLSQALTAGAYWLAFVGQTAAPTIRHMAGASPFVSNATFPSGSGTGWNNALVQTGVSGTLPTIGSLTDTDAPLCGVKF